MTTLPTGTVRPGLTFAGQAGRVRNNYPFFLGAAAAPTSYAADALTPGNVPANLRVVTDPNPASDWFIKWDAVPASTSLGTLVRYEILAYERIVGTVAAGTTQFQMNSTADDHEPQISVRAVFSDSMSSGSMGMETPSIPSNVIRPTYKGYAFAPTTLPHPPSSLTVTPQWNQGAPQNLVEWYPLDSNAQYFRVDRDGVTLATGLYTLEYLDTTVLPGETHTYVAYGMIPELTPIMYSAASNSAAATALSAQPPVVGTNVVSDVQVAGYDGFAILDFAVPAGFTGEVRAYKTTTPDQVKYARANPTLKDGTTFMNRPRYAIQVDVPAGGADFVIELVDKLGPYQLMDMSYADTVAAGMTMAHTNTNGHGNPCNVPTAIGPQVTIHLTGIADSNCTATLTGSQQDGINFHAMDPFTPITSLNTELSAVQAYNAANSSDLAFFSSPDLTTFHFLMNVADSKFFSMNRHFMDAGDSGGTPGTGDPSHVSNGGNFFQCNRTFTLAAGQVLRCVFIVDNPQSSRRWVDLFLKAAGDPFLDPGKFFENNDRNTQSGNLIRLECAGDHRNLAVFYPANSSNSGSSENSSFKYNTLNTTAAQAFGDIRRGNFYQSLMNQPDFTHDLPCEIELTLQYTAGGGIRSRVRQRVRYSNDFTLIGGANQVGSWTETVDATSAGNVQWPWAAGTALQLCGIHEIYHLGIDARGESMDNYQWRRYGYNRRPYYDERHWHFIGREVLTTFPA